jgi:hypothetical protein
MKNGLVQRDPGMLARLRAWKMRLLARAIQYTETMAPIWAERRAARAAARQAGARKRRWLWIFLCLILVAVNVQSMYPHLRDDLAIRSRLEETIPHICGTPQDRAGVPSGYYALCHDHFVDQVNVRITADLITMIGFPGILLALILVIPWLRARLRCLRAAW